MHSQDARARREANGSNPACTRAVGRYHHTALTGFARQAYYGMAPYLVLEVRTLQADCSRHQDRQPASTAIDKRDGLDSLPRGEPDWLTGRTSKPT